MLETETLVVKALDVCLPPHLNVNLEGGVSPTPEDISSDCSTDRVAASPALLGLELPAGSRCACEAKSVPVTWDASCDAPGTDPSGVCLLAGSDPEQPTPDPLSTSLLAPTSVCEVAGEATVTIDDQDFTTAARGVVQIHGRPCASGQVCRVGVSYQLTFDNIVVPVRFHTDPRFVDLALSGASEPLAVELGPFGELFPDLHVGTLPAAASLNSVRGQRSGSPDDLVAVGRNAVGVGVSVSWLTKHCLLDGEIVRAVEDDDGETTDVKIRLSVGGLDDSLSRLVNQPPRADAGPDQTVECTSPAGAPVTLDAGGTAQAPRSTDADGNIAFFVWRCGSEDGAQVAAPSTDPVVTTHTRRSVTPTTSGS